MSFNCAWPVVTEADVHLRLDLKQFADVNLPNMIPRLYVVATEWKSFVMWFPVIEAFPYTGQSSNTQWTETQDVGSTHVVDVRRNPASVVELP